MTVYRNRGRYDTSNVEFRDGRIIRYDKAHPDAAMEHIDYGLGILSGNLLDEWPFPCPFDLADIYKSLASAGRLAGYEVSERFWEIGSPRGLEETETFLRRT